MNKSCRCQGNQNSTRLCFHSNLLKTLEYISNLLKEHNIPFWLMSGTLLGAVRNNKMVPWDIDIDLGVWHHDANKILDLKPRICQDGFELGLIQAGPVYWNIPIYCSLGCSFHVDMFTWIIEGKTACCVENKRYSCPTTDLQSLDEIEFEGSKYPCPQHPESTLSNFYGVDWIIPKVQSQCIKTIRYFPRSNKEALAEIKKYGYYD